MALSTAPAAVQSDEVDMEFEERELTRFEQADECLAIVNGDELYWPSKCKGESSKSTPSTEDGATLLRTSTSIKRRSLGTYKRDAAKAEAELKRLLAIIDAYQEQDYLLDPYLERLLTPPVTFLSERISRAYADGQSHSTDKDIVFANVAQAEQVQRVATVIYHFIKVRGYKTIINFFPHEVDDLIPTLCFLEACSRGSIETSWELRYILLLWAALVCKIPFDLAQLDAQPEGPPTNSEVAPPSIMTRMVAVGKDFLSAAGKERDAAALLLARLLMRRDASKDDLQSFLVWCVHAMTAGSACTVFQAAGIYQTICEILKVGDANTLAPFTALLQVILVPVPPEQLPDLQDGASSVDLPKLDNSVIKKLKVKLACRLGLLLVDVFNLDEAKYDVDNDHLFQEVEELTELCRQCLGHKDTIVRYSAAKGFARMISRISRFHQSAYEQDLVINISLFGEASDPDHFMPEYGDDEYMWQGSCLALAELARKRYKYEIHDLLKAFVCKALRFDLRRGAHSVGSGVRDAACYLVWSLARSSMLSASVFAQDLVCIALFDRETSIRRAASAAYQECVGRERDIEDGIDIVGKTDFYAIANRRNAYLQCAPAVAIHKSYRDAIVGHIITACLPHWDVSIRKLGAESLARIAKLDLKKIAPHLVELLSEECTKTDPFTLHGALLALAELGIAIKESTEVSPSIRADAFRILSQIAKPSVRAPNSGHILTAACRLIATCISKDICDEPQDQPVHVSWLDFMDLAMESSDDETHDAVALAFHAASRVTDMSGRLVMLMRKWPQSRSAQRQAVIRVLGAIDYLSTPSMLRIVLDFLLEAVGQHGMSYSHDVEIRQRAYRAMSSSLCSLTLLDPLAFADPKDRAMLHRVFASLLAGLEDYSNDARGDVGSWVRKACILSMRELLFKLASDHVALDGSTPIDEDIFNRCCAAIAKQVAERIDTLRSEALRSLLISARAFEDHYPESTMRVAPGIVSLFNDTPEILLQQHDLLYNRYVCLLGLPPLRQEILRGIIIGIGAQRETINQALASALCQYLRGLTGSNSSEMSSALSAFVTQLADLALANIRVNQYFVPCLQTFNVLIEDGVLSDVDPPEVATLTRVQNAANASITKVKGVPRILAAMQFTINTLAFPALQQKALERCKAYLVHPFPTIRASASEALYLGAQEHLAERYTDVVDELLTSTPWSEEDVVEAGLEEKASKVVTLLKEQPTGS